MAGSSPSSSNPAGQVIETAEVLLSNEDFLGLRFPQLVAKLPAGVAIAAVRREHRNQLPSEQLVLKQNDVLLVTATDKVALASAVALLGKLEPGRITSHREDLDYIRVFASKKTVVGCAVGDLPFPEGLACSVVQVRRGDSDLLPSPELILEVGDRVGLLAPRKTRLADKGIVQTKAPVRLILPR